MGVKRGCHYCGAELTATTMVGVYECQGCLAEFKVPSVAQRLAVAELTRPRAPEPYLRLKLVLACVLVLVTMIPFVLTAIDYIIFFVPRAK